MSKISHTSLLSPVLLTLLSIIALLAGGQSFSFSALLIALRQSSVLGFLCIGLSLVVLTGTIDFSVGSIMGLGSCVCALILSKNSDHVWIAVIAALLVCTLCGFLNGYLVTHLGFSASVITFVQMFVISGISMVFHDRIFERLSSPVFFDIFNGKLFGLPTGSIAWVLTLALISTALHHTYWGQYIYAIGDNEMALVNIGVNTSFYKILAYSSCGFFAGLAGIYTLGRLSVSTSSTNISMVFEALTVLSISGVGFSDSRGRLPALFLGTLSLAVVKICMTLYALSTGLQNVIVALIFLASLIFRKVIQNFWHTQGDSTLET